MRAMRVLAACAVGLTCARDGPVAPKLPAATRAEAPTAGLSADDRAALAGAITDAQKWLLPSRGERDVATDAIARRFTDLATSLERADTDALAARFAAARQELEASPAEQQAERRIEFAALGLVLEGVEAVLQGKRRLVPFDAAAPHAPPSANEPKRPTLVRNIP